MFANYFSSCELPLLDLIGNLTKPVKDCGLLGVYYKECRPKDAYKALVDVIMVCIRFGIILIISILSIMRRFSNFSAAASILNICIPLCLIVWLGGTFTRTSMKNLNHYQFTQSLRHITFL